MNILERIKDSHTICCGPYIGEFGWELFGWQGYLRALKKKYSDKKIIVACQPGHDILYTDFASDIRHFDPHSGDPDTYRRSGFEISKVMCDRLFPERVDDPDVLHIFPPTALMQDFIRAMTETGGAKYIDFDVNVYRDYDILIHARSTSKLNTEYRNWHVNKWDALIGKLWDRGIRMASIGTKGGAYHMRGTYDLRGITLRDLVSHIKGTKLVAGPSSGPMHLASLCKTPHVVWTASQTVQLIKNRDRYETLWNPYNTPVTVIDNEGWQPSVETVYNSIVKMLRE